MTHVHELRNWPFSNDVLCIKCGYMVVGDVHYPWGKWRQPAIPVSSDPEKCGHPALIPEEGGRWRCKDCGSPMP
jgi:hypothetical protein